MNSEIVLVELIRLLRERMRYDKDREYFESRARELNPKSLGFIEDWEKNVRLVIAKAEGRAE